MRMPGEPQKREDPMHHCLLTDALPQHDSAIFLFNRWQKGMGFAFLQSHKQPCEGLQSGPGQISAWGHRGLCVHLHPYYAQTYIICSTSQLQRKILPCCHSIPAAAAFSESNAWIAVPNAWEEQSLFPLRCLGGSRAQLLSSSLLQTMTDLFPESILFLI